MTGGYLSALKLFIFIIFIIHFFADIMFEITVGFSYWERIAGNGVLIEVSHDGAFFGDGGYYDMSGNKNQVLLEPWYELKKYDFEYRQWRYKASQSPTGYLHGPASLLSRKSIVYPSTKYYIQIACPCFECRGYLCKNFAIETVFENHKSYHHATHANCKFCCDLLEIFPFFSFVRTIRKQIGSWCDGLYEDTEKTFKFSVHFQLMDKMKLRSIRSFKCEECGRRFTQSNNRDRHYENVHNKQSRYECNICKKVFGRKDSLARHKKIHIAHEYESEESGESETEEESSFEESSSDIDDEKDDIRTSYINWILEKIQV